MTIVGVVQLLGMSLRLQPLGAIIAVEMLSNVACVAAARAGRPREWWIASVMVLDVLLLTALLHFDKLFQIPLILAHGISGIAYRDMIETFMVADPKRFPLIGEINAFFESEARSIQQGGAEYVFSKEYLNIFWPADEYIFVKLTAEGKFDAFYAEAGRLLSETVSARHSGLPLEIIDEAIRLNHALVHQPFAKASLQVKLRFDLLDYWYKVRGGEQALLREAPTMVEVNRTKKPCDDFQKWCREIVWWGNKKGAYLYAPRAAAITPELAGHY